MQPQAAPNPPRTWPAWSLRAQLTAAVIGVLLAVLLPLAALLPGLARAHALAVLENRLAAAAQLIADRVAGAPLAPDPALDALAKRLGAETDLRITLIALDGTVVGESHQDLAQVGNHAARREVQQALAQGRGVDLHRSETVGYEMLYVAVPIVADGTVRGVARVALPLSEVDHLIAALVQTVLLAAGGASLLALGVGLVATRTIARPLDRLTRAATDLAADLGRSTPDAGWRRAPHGSPSLDATGTGPPPAPAGAGSTLGAAPAARAVAGLRAGVARPQPAEVRALAAALDRLAAAVQHGLEHVRAERDRLDAVLAHLADGVVLIDSAGRVERLNPAAAQLLGLAPRLAAGRTVAEVVRDHELVELVERARTSDTLPRVSTAFLEWQHPRRFLRAAVTRFGHGDRRQTLLVLQDLTELRRLETIRRDFVANVSHELRTPIAAIKAMVETLHDGAIDDPAAARDFVARIEEEVDGLHQLVEELLELSRLESGRVALAVASVDPAPLVRTAVRRLAPLAERAGVTLTADVAPGLPALSADPERLEQVLVGILHNAIKFTPPGGRIVVRATLDGDRLRIAVADTGIGLDPTECERIFERFYKARHPVAASGPAAARPVGGTGLGLAIAKHTVQLHGGTIWAESPGPGHGTTVHLALPLAPPAA